MAVEKVSDLRIIPARAGFTAPSSSGSCARPDHPRSRGVYTPVKALIKALTGSSPLARGLHSVKLYNFWDERIIPARAGFTARGCGAGYG